MNKKIKNTYFVNMPAWTLSIMASIVTLVVMFILGYFFGSFINVVDSEFIGYIIYDILIIVFCFYICRIYPKSYWYVPILTNLFGLISAMVEPTFWETNQWKIICTGWILSVLSSLLGRNFGLKKL